MCEISIECGEITKVHQFVSGEITWIHRIEKMLKLCEVSSDCVEIKSTKRLN